MDLKTKIAGNNTKADWLALRIHLRANLDSVSTTFWQDAFDNYFRKRLKTKFLDSLGNIISINEKQKEEFQNNHNPNRRRNYFTGEGFSMVIIECVVLEILASFRKGQTSNNDLRINIIDREFYEDQGIVYDQRVNQDSRELLINFLKYQNPFRNDFSFVVDNTINPPKTLAHTFYGDYRNYLIHNGDTNHNCKIRVINKENTNLIISTNVNQDGRNEILLYRNALYFGILRYITLFREEIVQNANRDLRLNFLLKMDDLCQTDEN